ncbi:MAG: restriction endonuclease [Marmoricola sp.]
MARARDSDELTAIQCKFYAPEHSVQKADIDSFFTASGKEGFTRRIVVSTSDRWSKNAEEALVGQHVSTCGLSRGGGARRRPTGGVVRDSG